MPDSVTPQPSFAYSLWSTTLLALSTVCTIAGVSSTAGLYFSSTPVKPPVSTSRAVSSLLAAWMSRRAAGALPLPTALLTSFIAFSERPSSAMSSITAKCLCQLDRLRKSA